MSDDESPDGDDREFILPPGSVSPGFVLSESSRAAVASVMAPFARIQQQLAAQFAMEWASPLAEWSEQIARQASHAFDWGAATRAGEVIRHALRVALPWNLQDDSVDLEAAAHVALTDGIPLAWVPRTTIVGELIACRTTAERFDLLMERRSDVLDDCIEILDDRDIRTRLAERCREAIAAARDGHDAVAQSHASNVIDSIVIKVAGYGNTKAVRAFAEESWLDQHLSEASTNMAMRPLSRALAPWWPGGPSSPPEGFSRHATTHAAGEQDVYTPQRALLAVMLATSLAVECAPNSGRDADANPAQ